MEGEEKISSMSPERSEMISKLISKYSPVLGNNSIDEKRK